MSVCMCGESFKTFTEAQLKVSPQQQQQQQKQRIHLHNANRCWWQKPYTTNQHAELQLQHHK